MTNQELSLYRDALIAEFTPFWELNDPAHRVDHFKDVEVTGMRINRELGLGYPLEMITATAYLHDLFTWSRINHHLLSAQWAETTDHWTMVVFSDEQRMMIAAACREHRASYRGMYTGPFSELMASADRGMPKPVLAMVNRSIEYTKAQGHTVEEATPLAIAHVKDKYSKGGYGRYPNMYYTVFGKELGAQYQAIKTLTVENFHELLV